MLRICHITLDRGVLHNLKIIMKHRRLILLSILAIGAMILTSPINAVIAKESPKITKAVATKAVRAKLPAGKILSSELERESGQLIWSFDVRDGYDLKEVWVDANSGEVSKVETETPAKEEAEHKMDKAEAIVKRKTHGKVTSGTTEGSGKDMTYVFQVQLKDGSTQAVRVSAQTFKILK